MEPSRIVPTRSAAGLLLAALGLAGSGQAGRAQAIDGAWEPPPAAELAVAMAPDGGGAAARLALGQALGAAPLHVLRSAEEGARDQLDALRAWNAAGKRPLKNGFARPLPAVLEVRFDSPSGGPGAAAVPLGGGFLAEAEPGWLAWGTHVKVTGAHRVRFHLTAVHLPGGTRMYVAAPGQAPERFGLELLAPGGDLWTPSVLGDSALLEVDVPAAALATHPPSGFAIREVMEILDLAGGIGGIGGIGAIGARATSTSCLVDARCETDADLPHIDNYRHAVAQLIFTVPGQGSFLCTGSLLNDVASDGIPYLLTANHCISDQATALSLQAFFDFYTATCNGAPPAESGRPHSNGSTLLATASADASSDYTLLKLNSVPAGRFFLGWNADPNALQADTALYRISYPAPAHFPQPQSYTQYTYDAAFDPGTSCLPRPNFLYERLVKGATFGGSSGSPVLLASGQVVGQLNGGCGPDPNNSCDYANEDDDGAFAVSFAVLRQWLAPQAAQPCVPGATTLCIDDKPGDRRFQATVAFHTTQGGGISGAGHAIALSTLGVTQGGVFWFFGSSNPEMLLKVLNGCALGGSFWVFFAADTNAGFTLTVVDTTSGSQRVYTNADLHTAAPVQDTSALPCP
ncbi:MAG TPA: serine protease [Thermoanaerobaculia bacterium]|nr:serine protease [Thermoanaerobaculia bacterium]